MNCETCFYYNYDEEFDQYFCEINLDEDEYFKFLSNQKFNCNYYRFHDDYQMVKKQM